MDFSDHVILGVTGVVSGFINVLAGGGSLLTVPAMIFVGLTPAAANGTNRIAILAQSAAAVEGFRRKGYVDVGTSVRLAACTIPGAVAGAIVAVHIDPDWFKRILALVMIAVLIITLRPAPASPAAQKAGAPGAAGNAGANAGKTALAGRSAGNPSTVSGGPRRPFAAYMAMVGIGFYGGFIQAGVGFLLMAVLHTLLRLDLVRVNMHKVLVVGIYTVPALLVFILQGEVVWGAAFVVAAGNALGGWIGANVAVTRGERVIRVVFALTVLAMAVRLLMG